MSGAVVVTGASTGIGRATALRLASSGYTVFAGVRKDQDAESLRRESPSLIPLILDVTDPEHLGDAVRAVEAHVGAQGLRGLVNNAGISGGASTEFLPLDDLRGMLEVNVVGVVATTQAFLPLLRLGGGRIVCIGSISGRMAVPFLAAYSMSKAAVSALCDSLRGELRPWGIHVAMVEPGAIRTPIWDKGLRDVDESLQKWPQRALQLYGAAIPKLRTLTEKTASSAIPPENVAKVVEHALSARRPRTRYLVGTDARVQAVVRRVPDRARDAMVARMIGLPREAPNQA
jgi:NAD(P)-dependent dehydrogenase (short-subunit alcohol dehydrogenase family)